MEIILEQWDAIELFSRVISRYKKKPLVDFKNNNTLINHLTDFSKKSHYANLAKEMRTVCDEPDLNNEKGWYDFVHHIRYSLPVVVPHDIFLHLCAYVSNNKTGPAVNNIDDVSDVEVQNEENKKKKVSTKDKGIDDNSFVPISIKTSKLIGASDLNNKQRLLEETNYWLYFYDEFDSVENGILKTHCGVSKALLQLKLFGKAELIRLRDDKTHRVYQGSFQLIKSNEYLFFKMKVKDERHLRMLFFIGSDDKFTLSVGMSAHISTYDNARAMIIEPIKGLKFSLKNIGFYDKDDKQNRISVPAFVLDYFLKEDANYPRIMKAPKGITSPESLYRWMSNNNNRLRISDVK